jgi:hypothetical protein
MRSAATHYKRDLRKLTEGVTAFLAILDREMGQPSTEMRGRRIAKLCNDLDMLNDRIRYSALGIDFRTDSKPARKAALASNLAEGSAGK